MNIKLRLSIVVITIWGLLAYLYNFFQSQIESISATHQLEDNPVTYAISRHIAEGAILQIISIFFIVVLALIWIPPMSHHKETK